MDSRGQSGWVLLMPKPQYIFFFLSRNIDIAEVFLGSTVQCGRNGYAHHSSRAPVYFAASLHVG